MSELPEPPEVVQARLVQLGKDRDKWHERAWTIRNELDRKEAEVRSQSVIARALRKEAKKAKRELDRSQRQLDRDRAELAALEQAEESVSTALNDHYIPF